MNKATKNMEKNSNLFRIRVLLPQDRQAVCRSLIADLMKDESALTGGECRNCRIVAAKPGLQDHWTGCPGNQQYEMTFGQKVK
jgi:hypothetical protein